jgi:hypothetical protein
MAVNATAAPAVLTNFRRDTDMLFGKLG